MAVTTLQAKFKYEYKASDGRLISFKTGDEFTLVNKASADWWMVTSKTDSKPFYVPANYMIEQAAAAATKAVTKAATKPEFNGNSSNSSLENASEAEQRDDNYRSRRVLLPRPDYETASTKPKQAPPPLPKPQLQLPHPIPRLIHEAPPPSVTSDPDPEPGSSSPPMPRGQPVQVLGNNWEAHYDENGRKFYFNTASKERSWDPPTRKVTSPLASPNSPAADVVSSNDNLPTASSSGWMKEITESGEISYVNQINEDRWFMSLDEKGKPYYYSNDSIASQWELPEVAGVGVLMRRRSSGSEVWRRSEQEKRASDRSSKVRSMYPSSTSLGHPRKSATLPGNLNSLGIEAEADPAAAIPPGLQRSLSDLAMQQDLPPPREGYINRAKLMENGRKVKKNWNACFAVLYGPRLYFFKDQKSATPKPSLPPPKAESMAELKGALLEWTKDKSSKKNVFCLSTMNGLTVLLQCENHASSQMWFECLNSVIRLITPSRDTRDYFEELSDEDEFDGGATSKPTKTSSTLSQSEKQNRISHRLKRLLSRRPDKELLQKKGIYKDRRVFGNQLQLICERDRSTVPKFVLQCVVAVDKRGLQADGIYRISGNLSHVQKIRFIVDRDQRLDFEEKQWEDIHVVASALKTFFRELKEPLIPFSLYTRFLAAIKIQARKARLQAVKDLVRALPRNNYDTLRVLCDHLARVILNAEFNRMNSQNVAIVFGPTLMWPESEEGSNIAVNTIYQNQIVELILTEMDAVFK